MESHTELKNHMEKTIEALKQTFQSVRTSRASISLLDKIKAEVYGSVTSINQLATVSSPEARMLLVQVWDKQAVKPLEKSISDAGLGFSTTIDGQTIRVTLPELTEQRREELCRYVSKYAEEARISIRTIRRDALEKIKNTEHISEDTVEHEKKEIQKITDEFNEKVEHMIETKKADIMHV